jgi:tetratricopeptide (TPR) repeat protein
MSARIAAVGDRRTVAGDQRPAVQSSTRGGFARRPAAGLLVGLAVVFLLAVHYLLAYTATLTASTTFDEPLHMVAGVAYWSLDDYRLQPENGNLPQRWCAIPLLFMNLTFPPLDQDVWRQGEGTPLGRQYLYTLGNDPEAMLAASRAMATVWSTALCLVVFLWSRSIFGTAGGLVSLVLAAFWPALVAHGPLATSDACGMLFFTLGAWSLWQLFSQITPVTLVAVFLAVGLSAIAKHSSVMLGPLAIVYLATVAALGRPLVVALGPCRTVIRGRWQRTALAAASLVVPLAGALFFIWASCGFRYEAGVPSLGAYEFAKFRTLSSCNEHAGIVGVFCDICGRFQFLPEAWLYGMSFIAAHMRERYAFALGAYAVHGWWWYFPLCLAIKNTFPSLALSLWGVGLVSRDIVHRIFSRVRLDPAAHASLALFGILVVLWPTFLTSHLNIGERHMLPSYPALMVLAGGTLAAASSAWVWRTIVVLLALHALDVTARWPYSLAYFNQIVPRGHEYQWLVDSNLDWGQDLLRLRAWLDRHAEPGEPVYDCYFGSDLVDRVLPQAESIDLAPSVGIPRRLQPGLYCISATLLQGVYAEPLGPWCTAFEATYQRARHFIDAATEDASVAGAIVSDSRSDLPSVQPDEAADDAAVREAAVHAFNLLQAGRLRAFLRQRAPDANVGGSILVFRLSAADLEAALLGPPAELEAVSWMERDSGGDAATLIRQSDRLFNSGALVEAEEMLEQATRLDPASAVAWDRLGLVYAARNRHDAAIAAHDKAANLDPRDPKPLYHRGNLLAATDRIDEAITAYDAAIARDADFAPAYFNRGVLKLRQGAEDAAANDLIRYRQLGGKVPPELERLLDRAPRNQRP